MKALFSSRSRTAALIIVGGLVILALLCPVLLAREARRAADFYPAEKDPFMGNWTGRWTDDEDVDPDISAQIIATGRNQYTLRLASRLFMRSPVLATLEGRAKNGVLEFTDKNYRIKIEDGILTGRRSSGSSSFSMKPYTLEVSALGKPAPEGAEVLFDGIGFDAFTGADGWEIVDDAMMVLPGTDDLESRNHYLDAQLHVEFRLPFQPKERGQSRGNSGVFLQGTYEVQILDSFGLEGTYDECGALYKLSAPQINACLPPGEWQSYDIHFTAARFAEDGTLTANPRMTVYQNGFLIHNDQELTWITAWKEKERLQPPPTEAGPVILQSHRSHYVQFRNVWIKPL
ncbi:MAG: DUF1080 domain-containing protein [Candidatus Hydrogenedens sp.]|nr:DUF1080 domain-containing protein [Candidatus Hydrogenedens sp.]